MCVCGGVLEGVGGLLGHRMLVVGVPVEPLLIVFSHNVNHTLAEELEKRQRSQ